MNRRARRAKRAQPDTRAVSVATAYQCPDCDSRSRLEVDASGVHHLHVYHDDTCPRLNGVTS
jgi:hypothetical protein